MTHIAIENGHGNREFPSKNGEFYSFCQRFQRVAPTGQLWSGCGAPCSIAKLVKLSPITMVMGL